MEESLSRYLPGSMTELEAGSYSPLVLAFLGDSVYETAVRTMLVKRGNARPNELNRKKSRLVKAKAQSRMMETLEPILTEEEANLYRRGRNAKSYTMAKNASMADYRRATGFEALMGYLYLLGQTDRYLYLIDRGIRYLEDQAGKKQVITHYEAK